MYDKCSLYTFIDLFSIVSNENFVFKRLELCLQSKMSFEEGYFKQKHLKDTIHNNLGDK